MPQAKRWYDKKCVQNNLDLIIFCVHERENCSFKFDVSGLFFQTNFVIGVLQLSRSPAVPFCKEKYVAEIAALIVNNINNE